MSTLTIEDQATIALEKANVVRSGKAQLRREIQARGREGAFVLADMILDPPLVIERSYVWQIVNWAPKVGDARAARMLRSCGIDPWRRLGKLTPRQADALAVALRSHAVGSRHVRKLRERRLAGELPPSTGRTRPRCSRCGVGMRRRSPSGKCGFCEDES